MTMSAVIVIAAVARPGPTSLISTPSRRLAVSASYIACAQRRARSVGSTRPAWHVREIPLTDAAATGRLDRRDRARRADRRLAARIRPAPRGDAAGDALLLPGLHAAQEGRHPRHLVAGVRQHLHLLSAAARRGRSRATA